MSNLTCSAVSSQARPFWQKLLFGAKNYGGAVGCGGSSPNEKTDTDAGLPDQDAGVPAGDDGGENNKEWQCRYAGEEPSCYFENDFTASIVPGSDTVDHQLLIGFNYDLPPDLETSRLDFVFRTDRDYLQASRNIESPSGRMCVEGYVYRYADSAPMYLQGYSDPDPNYFEAGPYPIEVPPPSTIPAVCETAGSALEAFQIAMADPFYRHAPVIDETGSRLVFFDNQAYSGAFFKEGTVTLADLNQFEAATGAHPAIVVVYTDFVNGFPRESVDNIAAYGSIPFVKFMPLDWNRPGVDAFPLERTTEGDFDSTLNNFLDEVRATKGPVLVAFAHEVNNPNGYLYYREPEIFVAASEYLYNLALERGVNNFNGVVNLNNWPWDNYQNYVFRHELVASVAIDGFNFGAQAEPCWSKSWQTFDQVFKRPYLEAACYNPDLKLMIGEFSTSSAGGNKAAWYCDAFTKIKQYPFHGMVVFSFSKNEGACGFIDWDIR